MELKKARDKTFGVVIINFKLAEWSGGDFSLYNEFDKKYKSGSWPDGDSREIKDR